MASLGRPKAIAAVLALALAVAVALGMVAFLATKPADAAPRFKIVTRTFSSPTPITIPNSGAAAPYPSSRDVIGFNRGRILDVNLVLKNFSHTFPDDVDVMLSHRGVNRTVLSDVGGGNDANNITIRLDDEAAGVLVDNGALTAGSFKPANFGTSADSFPLPAPTPTGLAPLSGFDGLDPNGGWRLWVVDDSGGDTGQFAGGWSITIRARVLR